MALEFDAETWIEISSGIRVPNCRGYFNWKKYKEDEKIEKAKEKYTKQYLPEEFKDNVNPTVVELFTVMDIQYMLDVQDGLMNYNDTTFVEFIDEAIKVDDEVYIQINTTTIPALIRLEHELSLAMKGSWQKYALKQKENPTEKDLFVETAFMFFLPKDKLYGHSQIVIVAELFHM